MAKLTVGDPMPVLVLPDPAGQPLDFTHQALAGDTQLLWLGDGRQGQVVPPELAAATDELQRLDARAFAVLQQRAGPIVADGAVRVAFDPERRVAPTFGLERGGVVVVDPRGRIAAILPGPDFTGALEVCRRLHGRTSPAVHRGGAPVLIVPDVLDSALCEELIAFWHAGPKHENTASSAADVNASAQAQQVKRRSDVMLQQPELFNRVKTRFVARAFPELQKAFYFATASFETVRVGCYDSAAGGFFKRHRDNRTPFTAHRRFAMSLNLNTGAYEGGQIRFPEFGREVYEANAGGAVIFSCNLLHEALPVTKGRRFALFTFLTDAAGIAQEKEMVAKYKLAEQQKSG